MKYLIPFIIVITISIGLSEWLKAAPATYTTTTCSYTDVNDTINNHSPAVVSGDTVIIKAGTCDWAGVTLNVANKAITIKGEGKGTDTQCGTAGSQSTYTCIISRGPVLVWQTIVSGNLTQLSDMTIISNGNGTGTTVNCAAYGNAAINLTGFSQNTRITNVRIDYGYLLTGCWGLKVNKVVGVADHNTFSNHTTITLHAITVLLTGTTFVDSYGDDSWFRQHSQGGAGNFFIEDNEFIADAASIAAGGAFFTDHFLGGRIVMRFNTITGGNFQEHGTETGGRQRGFRHIEFYRNNFIWTGPNTPTQMSFRGGSGKAFDNTATGTMVRVVDLNTDRGGPLFGHAGYYPWAYCLKRAPTQITNNGAGLATVTVGTLSYFGGTSAAEGIANNSYLSISGADQPEYNGIFVVHNTGTTTFTYSISGTPVSPATGSIIIKGVYDRNDDATGYPCIDQLGRGKGDQLNGVGPNDGNTMSPKAWLNQQLDPVYVFNNLKNGVVSPTAAANGSDVVHSLRDFYNQNLSFDGQTQHGVGRGTRAERDAGGVHCTPGAEGSTGDAWWATDDTTNWNLSTTETNSANIAGLASGADGVLDLCDSTDHWVNAAYVPYTYPHPLNFGSAPPAPSNPVGLRFIGPTTSGSATLSWTPSTNTDFKSYKVYHGLASGSYTFPVTEITLASAATAHKPLAEYSFKSAAGGTHYFAVSEVNTQDLESPLSSEVSIALSVVTRSLSPTRTISPQRCNRAGGCGSPSSGSNILSESGDKIIIETGGGFAIKEN